MTNLAQKYKQNCPNCTKDIIPIMIKSKMIESGKRTTAARGDNQNIWIMACPECRLLFYDYQK